MNSKHCPYCNCNTKTIKKGTTSSNRQRYLCKGCNKTWTNKPRIDRLSKNIWKDFVFNNMPVRALAERYHKCPNKIRSILHNYQPPKLNLDLLSKTAKEAIKVIVLDATYFGRGHCVITILDAHTGRLLYFKEIFGTETNYEYIRGLEVLREANIDPKACVIDGRAKLAKTLEKDYGLLVQMCHFHMWQIVKRYLTNNPILEPNIELKTIIDAFVSKHTKTDMIIFAGQMGGWFSRNERWLNEKHRNEYGRLEYSHEDTRRAYKAIFNHWHYLFTYEKYPKLNIPKFSNIIEGKFGNAKDKLRIHHGYTNELKIKIFFSLLSGE